MSEIIRWALALTYMGSMWGLAAFLIYKRSPGAMWFLFAVTLVMLFTSIKIDSKDEKKKTQPQEEAKIGLIAPKKPGPNYL